MDLIESCTCSLLSPSHNDMIPSLESVGDSDSSMDSKSKCIGFDQIHVRYYDQTLGDNPSTSYGPPLSLDWKYRVGESMPVDDYEKNRGKRRSAAELMMTSFDRRFLLTEVCGTTQKELKIATRKGSVMTALPIFQKVKKMVRQKRMVTV